MIHRSKLEYKFEENNKILKLNYSISYGTDDTPIYHDFLKKLFNKTFYKHLWYIFLNSHGTLTNPITNISFGSFHSPDLDSFKDENFITSMGTI